MAKWYVEYKTYNKFAFMGGIEAADGKGAIEYVKAHAMGVNRILGVWHDDEEEETKNNG